MRINPRLSHALAASAALVLLGAGASWIYPPAGLIVVGGLLWLDLTLWSRGGKR